jgi:hypothetical protein
MRFSYVRVSQDFRDLPWGFRGTAALYDYGSRLDEGRFQSTWGDWGIYSYPVDVSTRCTSGTGQIRYIKDGMTYLSGAAYSSRVGPGC